MITKEIIDDISNLIYAGLPTQNAVLSDMQVLHWINVERAYLIKKNSEQNRVDIDPVLVQDLGCVEVQCVDTVECCNLCIPTDESILRTVNPVPIPISYDNSSFRDPYLFTYVGLVDYMTPFEFTSPAISRWSKFNKYTSHIVRAFYRKPYIYIINANNIYDLEVISIRGVFQNPYEAGQVTTCTSCKSLEDEYPIPTYLISPLKEIILKKYAPFIMNLRLDTSNDAKDLTSPLEVPNNG